MTSPNARRDLTLPGTRRSHSQLVQWTSCPQEYYLSRVLGVPRRPGVFFPAGTAIHKTTELYLTSGAPSEFDPQSVFLTEFAKACLAETASSGFQPDEWFTAGRGGGEGIKWWADNGPQQVQNFIDWYERSEATVWVTPDGQRAVELELIANFGGVPVSVRPDVIFQLGTALVVCDLKTSASKPASMRQLGLYASGIELVYGIRPKYGTFFMHRGVGGKQDDEGAWVTEPSYFQPPVPLGGHQYSVAYLTRQYEMFDRAVVARSFPANPGKACRRCTVAQACPEVTGKGFPR